MPFWSTLGAAASRAFGFLAGARSVTASYLQVAGGGGGGSGTAGGGGAGGLLTGTTSLSLATSYTVIIGAGGAGGAAGNYQGTNGSSSQFGTLTASAGGGGGGTESNTSLKNGKDGASGGGAGFQDGTTATGGAASPSGQGNAGGNSSNNGSTYAGGGGGGAGAAGGANSGSTAGNGGVGLASSISGTSTFYAGGGGGATRSGGGGAGGNGGGGQGTTSSGTAPTGGTANTGGGGGGEADESNAGGKGGSGVVIISYAGAQQFGGGVVTSVGGYTIHTFTTSGVLSPLSSLSASYLVVGGGGGGGDGNGGGGGGAGGYQTSSVTIDTNSTYTVTVGAGGNAGSGGVGTNGSNSVFSSTTSAGGGGGGYESTGVNGGSGGGGGGGVDNITGTSGGISSPTTSPAQGNSGGRGYLQSGVSRAGGGGGGAGAVGSNATTTGYTGGNGGNGTASSISGSSVTYAGGGGGGGREQYTATVGAGGTGGGGNGGLIVNATAGTANLGGGGGGAGLKSNSTSALPANGGSGIVIISYAGATQLMAGGTVTIVGGNVIHTFTSSGYLTPLTYVGNSLRFRSSASAYLNKTLGTPTNANKFTFSFWAKRGKLSSAQTIFNVSNTDYIQFNASDNIQIVIGNSVCLTTSAVYRDPAAWYHFVFSFDNSASPKWNFYVNGISGGTGTLGSATFNTAVAHYIANTITGGGYFDGYMANIQFVDGQALTPNSFGTFNQYGVWQPVNYGGNYGNNGFYLPFTNATSTTTLGYDFSPQGNNWTTNNISVTAGVTYDSMTDVPTLTSANASNYCVLNPISNNTGSPLYTVSNGNLKYDCSASAGNAGRMAIAGTMAFGAGKYYWEIKPTSTTNLDCGITAYMGTITSNASQTISVGIYNGGTDIVLNSATYSGTTPSFSAGNILAFAFDSTAGTMVWYRNNTLIGTFSNIDLTKSWNPYFAVNTGAAATNFTVNFGQQPFDYTPPSGYVALNTYNL